MRKITFHWIFWIIILIAFIVAIVWIPPRSLNGNECKTNSDCVPSSCCHSTSCVSIEKAPKCEGIMCTQECVPNTLDCGQRSCVCQSGICGTSPK